MQLLSHLDRLALGQDVRKALEVLDVGIGAGEAVRVAGERLDLPGHLDGDGRLPLDDAEGLRDIDALAPVIRPGPRAVGQALRELAAQADGLDAVGLGSGQAAHQTHLLQQRRGDDGLLGDVDDEVARPELALAHDDTILVDLRKLKQVGVGVPMHRDPPDLHGKRAHRSILLSLVSY